MDLLHATAELASRVDRLRPGVLDGPPPYPSIARRVAAEPVQDPVALVKMFAPQVEGHILEGVGHWTQQERPEEVNHILVDWLKRL